MDRSTHEALAFVNLITPDGKQGTSTDIEGKFVLLSTEKITSLRVSYIGYFTQDYYIDYSQNRQVIYLDKRDIELDAIEVLPGINPADTIMEKVIANRKKNNPEKNVSFSYTSYNKMIVTMNPDSNLIRHPEKIAALDTNTKEALAFFSQQHLFLAESITSRQFQLPSKSSEKVLASRISGFENPVFNLLATELQSFTFYTELFSLGGVQYEGPVSPQAKNRYFFLIEDTLFRETDTLWVISFRPKKNKSFRGMKGRMTISSRDWAIANVVAEPATESKEMIGVKIQQKYEIIDNSQWFPVQLNTILYFHSIDVDHMETIGIANGYITDIRLHPEINKKTFSYVDVSLEKDAAQKDEQFWNNYRYDSLDQKEINTYKTIDSIGKKHNLERRTNTFMYLLDGQWPIGKISIDLDRLINFNDYEGFRGGLGVHTNSRLSPYFSAGAYGAYGFKDKAFKYGGDIRFFLPGKDAEMQLLYQNDIAETGGVSYFGKRSINLTQDISDLYRNRFDSEEKYEAKLGLRLFRHYKLYLFASTAHRTAFEGYGIESKSENNLQIVRNDYFTCETGTAIRFQFRETFMQSGQRLISKGSPFPILWIKYSKGWDQLLQGQLDYQKFDLRLEKKHRIRRAGHIGYRIDLGKITGEHLPYGLMYNPRGTWRPVSEISVFSVMGFEVMRTNEFLADRYASAHLRYDMGSLFFRKKFRPQFSLVYSALIGDIKNSPVSVLTDVKIPEKAYMESGFLINNLIKSGISGFGVGVFYRYGEQALPTALDNWAFKLSLNLTLE